MYDALSLEQKTVQVAEMVALNSPYDFTSKTFEQIYGVLKKYGQDCIILLQDEKNTFSNQIMWSDSSLFDSFGMHFTSVNTPVGISLNKDVYLLILSEEDMESVASIRNAVFQHRLQFNVDEDAIKYVAIEKAYTELSELDEDNKKLREVLPTATCFNRNFRAKNRVYKQVLRYTDRNNVKYLNLMDFYGNKAFNSVSIGINIGNLLEVLEAIKAKAAELRREKIVAFFYCELPDDANRGLYLNVTASIAAYCSMVYNMKFELSREFWPLVFENYRKMISQRFNFIEDYLEFVRNPIDCGFRIVDDRLYSYIKDTEDTEGGFVQLNLTSLRFNQASKTLESSQPEVSILTLKDVEVLSLRDLFDLASKDWNSANTGARQLNDVMAQMERIFMEQGRSGRCPLCVNNTLLYRKDGIVRIARVDRILGKVPYVCKSPNNNSISFRDDLELTDLVSLYDFNLFYDTKKWLGLLQSSGVVSKHLHYQLPSWSRGVVMRSMKSTVGVASANCGVSVAELSLWLKVTDQFRNGDNKATLDYVTLPKARASSLLTCWGGPSAADRVKIKVTGTSVWR